MSGMGTDESDEHITAVKAGGGDPLLQTQAAEAKAECPTPVPLTPDRVGRFCFRGSVSRDTKRRSFQASRIKRSDSSLARFCFPENGSVTSLCCWEHQINFSEPSGWLGSSWAGS